jgi:hypothetical protein
MRQRHTNVSCSGPIRKRNREEAITGPPLSISVKWLYSGLQWRPTGWRGDQADSRQHLIGACSNQQINGAIKILVWRFFVGNPTLAYSIAGTHVRIDTRKEETRKMTSERQTSQLVSYTYVRENGLTR